MRLRYKSLTDALIAPFNKDEQTRQYPHLPKKSIRRIDKATELFCRFRRLFSAGIQRFFDPLSAC